MMKFKGTNVIFFIATRLSVLMFFLFFLKIKNRHMLLSFSCPAKIVNSLRESFNNNQDIISTRLNNLFVCRIERN